MSSTNCKNVSRKKPFINYGLAFRIYCNSCGHVAYFMAAGDQSGWELFSKAATPLRSVQDMESIEIIQGDGGNGSIRKINFSEGSQVKCIKNRIDELDPVNYSYKYTLIEGDELMDKVEKITYEVKFEATPEGGSKNKMTSTYFTKGDKVLTDEEIKSGKEKSSGMYKVVEAYLLQNPDAYT
ncbi:major allergen Pru ar 1-like [Melia azedarach]|uniref:Major allergen Pru ar 1-like n=1 Tax=Melia azedarach TaxID=155640 RepID=A0ACC1XN51_MELAZ|nr:major allergen Pru ar 1-like [Melia azedarach]